MALILANFFINKDLKFQELLERDLSALWRVGEIVLFASIGAIVNINLAFSYFIIGILIISLGLSFRYLGVFLSLIGSSLSFKERLFCAISYTPKATVQAALSALPLSLGLENANEILALSIISILFYSSLRSSFN